MTFYLKYRPKTIEELDLTSVRDRLLQTVKLGKFSHAYLFSGTRGTGKTTLARIVATEIGASVNDIYEIDAASNNGVDEIRLLNEAVSTLPLESRYKVYIFDEVHMFSKSAFNALLKTLEEPPKHVVFILATTEIDKLPETIISRCQVFTFKKASDDICRQLALAVARREGFELDAGSAELLAILADGSFRDLLGELQKVLNFSLGHRPTGEAKSKKIKREEIEKITGAPKAALVNGFLSALAENNLEQGIETVRQAANANLDMKLFLKLIIRKFRIAIVLRYAPKLEDAMAGDLSEEDLEFLKKLVKKDQKSMLRSGGLAILLDAYQNIDNAFVAELPLELALIKILKKE